MAGSSHREALVRHLAAYLALVLTLLIASAIVSRALGITDRSGLSLVLMAVGGLVVALFAGPSMSGVAERRAGDWKTTLAEGSTSATGTDLAEIAAHDAVAQDRYLLVVGGAGATLFVLGLAGLALGG